MPCTAKPPCSFTVVPLEEISVQWDGPAVGRKALAFPARKAIFLDSQFWRSLRSVDARAAILSHERGHVEGARCESCADKRAGEIMRREGHTQPRDGARALIGRLENRNGENAAADFIEGFGIDDEQTVTGYVRGAPVTISVRDIGDGQLLRADAAERYLAMKAAAARDGILLRCNSGWRDMEKQKYLYAGWVAKLPGFNLAAAPGYSNHQGGISADISTGEQGYNSPVYAWLSKNAASFGFVNDVAGEPWHWTFKGSIGRAAVAALGVTALILAVLVLA